MESSQESYDVLRKAIYEKRIEHLRNNRYDDFSKLYRVYVTNHFASLLKLSLRNYPTCNLKHPAKDEIDGLQIVILSPKMCKQLNIETFRIGTY